MTEDVKTMREIKFRAWHKKKKQMFTVYGWNQSGNIQITPNRFGAGADGEPVVHELAYYASPDDVEVMQFTGLKDKNGKEIYEGDTVRYGLDATQDHAASVKIGAVTWDDDWLTYNVGGDNHWDIDWMEVIGNIHENPKLMSV